MPGIFFLADAGPQIKYDTICFNAGCLLEQIPQWTNLDSLDRNLHLVYCDGNFEAIEL